MAVDIGSVKSPSKFAWAAFDVPIQDTIAEGRDPNSAMERMAAGFADNRRAVLLLESPRSVPVPDADDTRWRWLGKAREGEGNRPWSAGTGAGVLATGLAQAGWILSRLAAVTPDLMVTTQPDQRQAGRARLLLAEALVSGAGRPVPVAAGQHAADASAAGRAMVERLRWRPAGFGVRCAPHKPMNLLAATALWAELALNPDKLHNDVLVVRVKPVPVQP
ncbi:hypothetical protein F8568_022450 [Actinomadura sp. LD22]|uniref:Uncharacterized protein n=1 Tax=Actinomadura physcomitrii TaxID=2650748 RepID=A0A6I4M9J1_9ACTN|nr:hypothetical protein [Actinomadura physcomitrii]MWA02343.1 hypothetical protein [Actinomadura physcomitrii]MWA03085.1 hypothetical protein [Actinomadura physcomitrii]